MQDTYNPKQLEIKYFFPLTEQVNLDLDFKPCEKYLEELRAKQIADSVIPNGAFLIAGGGIGATTWATVNLSDVEPNFTIDIDQLPITVMSKQKPSFIRRYIYKVLGMKWKAK